MIRTTERGFAVYAEFADTYQNEIRIQESSAVEPRVWILCSGTASRAAHLDVSQAIIVRDALDEFIATHADLIAPPSGQVHHEQTGGLGAS